MVIEFPPYRLDPRAGRLWHGDRPVELRPKAWALLRYLAERSGALVTKEELHAAVWGDVVVSDDTLTQTLGELRPRLQAGASDDERNVDLRRVAKPFSGLSGFRALFDLAA
jgi:DNA-binding winged helix-turn-helix (wHTH) protein